MSDDEVIASDVPPRYLFSSLQEQNEAEREILAKMKAEDLQSILNLKKKQEGLIDPEFGARHRAFDIPNFDEVSVLCILIVIQIKYKL